MSHGGRFFFFTIPPRSDLVIAFWIVGRGNAANGYVFLNILQSLHNCFRAWNLRVGKMMFFVGRLPGGWYTLMDCNSLVSVYVKTKPSVKSFFLYSAAFLVLTGSGDDSGWCENDLQFQVPRSSAAVQNWMSCFNGIWWRIWLRFALINLQTGWNQQQEMKRVSGCVFFTNLLISNVILTKCR